MSTDYHWLLDKQLKDKEVKHRRALNGYKSTIGVSLGFGVSAVASTGAIAIPLVISGWGYKLYKIRSHQKKLDAIHNELAARQIPPPPEKKRDIFIPFATSTTSSLITHGIGHGLHNVFKK